MSIEAGTGNGADDPNSTFDYTREYIDACLDADGEFLFSAGIMTTRCDKPINEANKTALTDIIDGAFKHFMDDSQVLSGEAPAGDVKIETYLGWRSLSWRQIATLGQINSAGDAIRKAAFWSMPMEDELDGKGRASFLASLADGYVLEIIGKGTYGRDRFYKRKDGADAPEALSFAGANFNPVNDPLDPDYLGFEDWHRISFLGRIVRSVDDAVASS
jgi:hypothetical protein